MPQPTPTPTPSVLRFFGKEFPTYGPDVDEFMKKYLGDDFFQELEDYESGKSKVGPRPGWDYMMQAPMSPADAAEVQRYKDLRKKHRSMIPTPTPTSTPTAFIPATKKEGDSWLEKILGGGS